MGMANAPATSFVLLEEGFRIIPDPSNEFQFDSILRVVHYQLADGGVTTALCCVPIQSF